MFGLNIIFSYLHYTALCINKRQIENKVFMLMQFLLVTTVEKSYYSRSFSIIQSCLFG